MMTATMRAAALALLACAALSRPAAAETRTVQGDRLVVTDTSSGVIIDTDETLAGGIRLSADGSLACLSIVPGETAVIGTAACGDQLETLRITVSPTTPVTLSGSGDGSGRIGDLRAPVTATLTGSYDVKIGRTSGLNLSVLGRGDAVVGTVDGAANLDLTSSGDTRLGRLTGSLNVRRRGSGDLAVGAIQADGVNIDSTGSGDTLIGGGNIAGLHVSMSGSGDLAIAATVASGDVAASGGGDVKLGRVTGSLRRSAGGGSDITVGGSATVTDVMAKVASVVGGSRSTVHATSHWFGHLVALVLAGVMLFFVWRIVRRGGGIAGLRSAARPSGPGAPLHPGVVAVCDIMARLEQRLGRLETYVTTREFDLNRKFREMGP